MNIKIDTKEKFTVITPKESIISANMTVEFLDKLLLYLKNKIPHIVLNMENVEMLDKIVIDKLKETQEFFYDNNSSFVICCIAPNIEEELEKMEILELLNITPTESEAWDIVQMEEIERELLDGFSE